MAASMNLGLFKRELELLQRRLGLLERGLGLLERVRAPLNGIFKVPSKEHGSYIALDIH